MGRSQGKGRAAGTGMPRPGVPTTPEPPVRRWPHPVSGTGTMEAGDPTLHFISCALSYQNQLLADIKALLETLATEADPPSGKGPEG